MNNNERAELIKATGFNDMFPPVNIAIERGAWGAYQTEFYVTYDLRAAREAQNSDQ